MDKFSSHNFVPNSEIEGAINVSCLHKNSKKMSVRVMNNILKTEQTLLW